VLNQRVPEDSARIIFGVHDKSRMMHGVLLSDDPQNISASDACKRLKDHILEKLRRKLQAQLIGRADWPDKIIKAVSLEVIHLSSRVVSKSYALVCIELDFAIGRILPQATVLATADKKSRSRYFIRTSVPESRKMTEADALESFRCVPAGFPL